MPSWNEVLNELQACKRVDALDYVRRKYLMELHNKTKRNVIAYYSGWLQKPHLEQTPISDIDKEGFMTAIYNMNRSLGLDLILHTEGGNLAAAESIVDYLRTMFGNNIRAIIPQIAMSAGTMIACSCNSIIMGNQSNLGPIDPQFSGISASGVIEEFEQAFKEIKEDPAKIPLWQAIIGHYHPTFIGDCQKAISWSNKIVTDWLSSNMLKCNPQKVREIVEYLSSHKQTMSHSRHIGADELSKIGLNIIKMEADHELQDSVLTVHHAFIHTFAQSPAVKIIENHMGIASIQNHMIPLTQP